MDGLAQALADEEPNPGKITRIECTTTAADEPFTIEVSNSTSGTATFFDRTLQVYRYTFMVRVRYTYSNVELLLYDHLMPYYKRLLY